MTTVSPDTFNEWIKDQYHNLPQDRNTSVIEMIAIFMQSYEMLANWILAGQRHELDYNMYVHRSYERTCASIWYDFCIHCNMNKGAVKVIFATQMAETKVQLDTFSQNNHIANFEQWIDNIDKLAQSLGITDANTSRPFFSVVVACYNDGRYKEGVYLDRLLNSLCQQGIAKDEFEIILSDDCSPVPFDDIIEKYNDKLVMRKVKTDYNFAPGNTRQKGVDSAIGRWLCFADHDDMYYPNAFLAVKDYIEESQEKFFVYSAFDGMDLDDNVIKKYERTTGWCHGKFYNVDNLWKRQGIHFIPDLASHEDIAICTQVACAMDRMGEVLSAKYIPITTYAWTENPESLSHTKFETIDDNGKPRMFLEVFYEDYIKSTGYIYLDEYRAKKLTKDYCTGRTLEVLCYLYIYFQGFQTYREDYSRANLFIAGKFLNEVKKQLKLSNDEIYAHILEDNGRMYLRIEPMARISTHYIPHQGVKEWIYMIDKAYKDHENNLQL